jgi:hypothetical protein
MDASPTKPPAPAHSRAHSDRLKAGVGKPRCGGGSNVKEGIVDYFGALPLLDDVVTQLLQTQDGTQRNPGLEMHESRSRRAPMQLVPPELEFASAG